MRKHGLILLIGTGWLSGLLQAQSVEFTTEEIEFEASPDKVLEVQMRVDAGAVTIEKSAVPEKGTVNLEYRKSRFRSKVSFDAERNRLRVYVDGRGWGKWSDGGDHPAEIQIALPAHVDIHLDARLKAGEMTQNLGGLRIIKYHLSNWAGEVNVRFDEPNLTRMDFFDADMKIGEAQFSSLGNARFDKADINGGIGELEVDFTGDLVSKCQARVDLDIGEARIILPGGVGTRLQIGGGFSFLSDKRIDSDFSKRDRYYYSQDYDSAVKKFAIRVTPGLGELQIDRE